MICVFNEEQVFLNLSVNDYINIYIFKIIDFLKQTSLYVVVYCIPAPEQLQNKCSVLNA